MNKLKTIVITAVAAVAALACATPATAATKPPNRTLQLSVTGAAGQITKPTGGTCRATCSVTIAPDCIAWDPVHEDICKEWIYPEPQVTAQADTGNALLAWGDDCAGTPASTSTCSIDMNANRAASVRFEEATAPALTLPSYSSVTGRTINLSASASDASGIKEVRFFSISDDGTQTTIKTDTEAPFEHYWGQPNGLDDEVVRFGATAIDRSQFANATTVTRSAVVDTSAPAISIDSGPANNSTTTARTADFAFGSSADDVTEYECRIYRAGDGTDPFDACMFGTSTYAGLTEGTWVFEVRAIDKVRNVSMVASRTWTIVPPVTDDDPAQPTQPTTPRDPVQTPPQGATPPSSDPTTGPLAGQPAQPMANASECVVPNVRGKKLRAATKKIVAAGCAVGTVKRTSQGKAKPGRVVRQAIAPGTRVASGTTVGLKVRR